MHDVLLFPGLAISAGVALAGAVLRYTVNRQDSERERRFRELEIQVERLRSEQGALLIEQARSKEQFAALREEFRGMTARLA